MEDVRFRWIIGHECDDEDWTRIETICLTRGWSVLDRQSTRVLIAEDEDGKLKGFLIIQLIPHCEPMFVSQDMRGTGLAEELSDRMAAFLDERRLGYVSIAESKFAEELCMKHGMKEVNSPVFVKLVSMGTKEN